MVITTINISLFIYLLLLYIIGEILFVFYVGFVARKLAIIICLIY